MNEHYKYFCNRECEYFPCHKTESSDDFNCLFCYCPLYLKEHCPGKPEWIKAGERKIKDCSNCTFPHQTENYETVIRILTNTMLSDTNEKTRIDK